MTRAALLLVPLLAACLDPAPPAEETIVACERNGASYTYQRPDRDVLFVVDSTSDMGPYRDRWVAALRAALDAADSFRPDLRFGVVAASGGDIVGTVRDGSDHWYVCGEDPYGRCPIVDFDGSLTDAVAAIADLEPGSATTRTPIAAAHATIPTFRRPGAQLHLVFVLAGDDQSPDDYTFDAETIVGIAAPPEATRIRDAVAGTLLVGDEDITAEDWEAPLWIGDAQAIPGDCLHGIAYPFEAIVSDRYTGDRAVPCTMTERGIPAPDTPRPCWWTRAPDAYEQARYCPAGNLVPVTEGITWAHWRYASICGGAEM